MSDYKNVSYRTVTDLPSQAEIDAAIKRAAAMRSEAFAGTPRWLRVRFRRLFTRTVRRLARHPLLAQRSPRARSSA